MIASDRQSIFGDTYAGVPNPQIPFQHPYPTRYHGPIFTTPRFGLPFAPSPYALTPYAGLGDGLGDAGDVGRSVMTGAKLTIGLAGIGALVGLAMKNKPAEKVGQWTGIAAGVATAAYGMWVMSKVASFIDQPLRSGK